MNNNLYQWHDERMVDLEMRQIRHELGQANMFKEPGVQVLERLSHRVGEFFQRLWRRKEAQAHRSQRRSHPARKYKAAP